MERTVKPISTWLYVGLVGILVTGAITLWANALSDFLIQRDPVNMLWPMLLLVEALVVCWVLYRGWAAI